MKESKEKRPDVNDTKALKAYFEKVYPTIDLERVYTSDMKKMVKWLALLEANNIEIKLSDTPAEDAPAHELPKAQSAEPKQVNTKQAPAKKINSPRKMA